MTTLEKIQSALKSGKAIIGYEKSIKYIKLNAAKLIVLADNIQNTRRENIVHNANLAKIKVETFPGSSKDLGIVCGKPFPVTALVIKD
jgi:large subunit ribosomal protein L30e